MLKLIGKTLITVSIALLGYIYNQNPESSLNFIKGYNDNFSLDLLSFFNYFNCKFLLYKLLDFIGYILIMTPIILLDKNVNFIKYFSLIVLILLTLSIKINFNNFIDDNNMKIIYHSIYCIHLMIF